MKSVRLQYNPEMDGDAYNGTGCYVPPLKSPAPTYSLSARQSLGTNSSKMSRGSSNMSLLSARAIAIHRGTFNADNTVFVEDEKHEHINENASDYYRDAAEDYGEEEEEECRSQQQNNAAVWEHMHQVEEDERGYEDDQHRHYHQDPHQDQHYSPRRDHRNYTDDVVEGDDGDPECIHERKLELHQLKHVSVYTEGFYKVLFLVLCVSLRIVFKLLKWTIKMLFYCAQRTLFNYENGRTTVRKLLGVLRNLSRRLLWQLTVAKCGNTSLFALVVIIMPMVFVVACLGFIVSIFNLILELSGRRHRPSVC